jgi:hypothetical protein
MKYLKTFEVVNKKTVDPNEIYSFNVYTKKEPVYLVGKIDIHDNDYAPRMSGYIFNDYKISKKGTADNAFIKPQYWRTIRVATDEEKDFYNLNNILNKYNL